MRTLVLLLASNVLMTVAWYAHLKWPDKPIWLVVLASWGVAFFEYCFAVPANRIGHAEGWTLGQLKVTQEVITLLVFGVFAVLVFGERLTWRHAGAFACLVGAVGFMFSDRLFPPR